MAEIIKDARGGIIGRIEDEPGGKKRIRDKRGKLLGRFDPKNNKTTNAQGKIIGTGNLLTSLLTE